MNFIETIYCSQYHELKKTGRDPLKGRTNGTLLNATIILLAIISLLMIISRLSPHMAIAGRISGFFGEYFSGRAIGKVVGALGLLIIGGALHLTVGSKAGYERMIARWEQLPPEEMERTGKRSLMIFGIVFGIFLILFVGSFF